MLYLNHQTEVYMKGYVILNDENSIRFANDFPSFFRF